jgi:hypothetical protein
LAVAADAETSPLIGIKETDPNNTPLGMQR